MKNNDDDDDDDNNNNKLSLSLFYMVRLFSMPLVLQGTYTQRRLLISPAQQRESPKLENRQPSNKQTWTPH